MKGHQRRYNRLGGVFAKKHSRSARAIPRCDKNRCNEETKGDGDDTGAGGRVCPKRHLQAANSCKAGNDRGEQSHGFWRSGQWACRGCGNNQQGRDQDSADNFQSDSDDNCQRDGQHKLLTIRVKTASSGQFRAHCSG